MSSSLLSSKHSDLYIYNVQLEIYLICVPVGSPFSITSPVQITHSALQITNRQAYTFPCISYYMCKNEYIFQMHCVLLFVHVYVFSFRYTHIYVAFYCAVWLARLHQRISIYINLLVFCTHRILFLYIYLPFIGFSLPHSAIICESSAHSNVQHAFAAVVRSKTHTTHQNDNFITQMNLQLLQPTQMHTGFS